MKKPKFQSPTGMHDILPEEQKYFQKIYNVAKEVADFYGFQKIDTPIIEQTELFSRGIGLTTDIVEKEMYAFRTKGGDFLALRPEGTAPIVRAYIEHGMFNLPSPVKLWYFGPYFRHEHPQAGRFRQFHQFGFEALKEKGSVVDVRIIQIFYNILKELKFKNLIVKLNSIGDSQCRPYYRKLLVSYLKSREQSFCTDCRRRIKINPLRVLDCKKGSCRKIVSQAPQLIDHLCEECHAHFKEVLEFLDKIELPYSLDPYLVRGLDYYTKTVFEIIEADQGAAHGILEETERKEERSEEPLALVGGGRYDALVKLLGGKDTPACGGAAGVERIVSLIKSKGIKFFQPLQPKVFLAQLGDLAKKESLKLFEDFRKANIVVGESFSKDSLKTQLKIADKLKVDYALILGQKEVLERIIILREMKSGKQETVKLDKIIDTMKKKLKKQQ